MDSSSPATDEPLRESPLARPLRFLFLTTFYPPHSFGGDAMYIYRLAHLFGGLGHTVDVVHCVDSFHLFHAGAPAIDFAEHPNVHRHELRSGYGWLSPLITQQTGRPYFKTGVIRRLLDEHRYDVIHYHNISLLGPGVLTLGPARERPVKLYTAHEHWLVCPTHVLWKYTGRPCDKPDCLRCVVACRRPPQLWRYTGYLRRCAAHVDQFLAPSRFAAAMHRERGFPFPVAHLPYFIECSGEDGLGPGAGPHANPYFLFVGRLEEIKGLQTLIPLWRHSQVPFDLLVAGSGSHETSLRAMAAGNSRIRFLGALPQHKLGVLYAHALACIVPSITYETFGMVNIEAFARKTPVIVRDLGALPEVVNDSGGGIVFRNDQELISAVRDLGSNPELRRELGERGHAALLRYWDQKAHLALYTKVLEDVLGRKGGIDAASPAQAGAVE